MNTVLTSVLTLGALGLVFGTGLYLAYRRLRVRIDPRVEEVLKKLPGANCGACGQAGCPALAEALVKGEAEVVSCAPAGPETHKEIARILGREIETKEKEKAVLLCGGGNKAKESFRYQGIKDCRAAALLLGGNKACRFGCLGWGSCVGACPFDAITMGEDNLPRIDLERCTGCGKCVTHCPKELFLLVPESKIKVSIRCRSQDKGGKVRKVCQQGCIACMKCVKVCPVGAITVEENLARIDYEKCTGCSECVKVCPTRAIVDIK